MKMYRTQFNITKDCSNLSSGLFAFDIIEF